MQSLDNKQDPAPSRIFYRLERLWLTPLIRLLVRFGLPLALITIISSAYLSRTENTDILKTSWREFKENTKNRPEFLINFAKIDGLEFLGFNEVRSVMNIDFPISSYDIDITDLASKVQLLNAVDSARLYIADNIIHVEVIERKPAVFWRNNNSLEILDANGISLGNAKNRIKYGSLPVIAGQGADKHVKEALFIYKNTNLIANEIIGLVRVGNRRWDIILTGQRKVQLPVDEIAYVLRKIVMLNKSYSLFSQNFKVLDLRNMQRITIRRNELANETTEIKLYDFDEGEI